MKFPTPLRIAVLPLAALVIGGLVTAVAAANTVPPSNAGSSTRPITANDLKPPECAALALTAIVAGSGTFSGSSAAELILGSGGADIISGNSGNDCMLGGSGNDTVNGDGGADVLIGGAGDDILTGGSGNDFLYGGPGNDNLDGGAGSDYCNGGGQAGDTFTSCSTIVP